MKTLLCLVTLLGMATGIFAAPKSEPKQKDAGAEQAEPTHIEDKWVVILGVYKGFQEAKADGKKFAKASRVPFTLNGMVFDKKGLHYPDDLPDEAFAGEYLARRMNSAEVNGVDVDEHLSVEKSDGYTGFQPGFYLVVGSIESSARDAKKQVTRFAAFSKTTYSKKTSIYMGCLH